MREPFATYECAGSNNGEELWTKRYIFIMLMSHYLYSKFCMNITGLGILASVLDVHKWNDTVRLEHLAEMF